MTFERPPGQNPNGTPGDEITIAPGRVRLTPRSRDVGAAVTDPSGFYKQPIDPRRMRARPPSASSWRDSARSVILAKLAVVLLGVGILVAGVHIMPHYRPPSGRIPLDVVVTTAVPDGPACDITASYQISGHPYTTRLLAPVSCSAIGAAVQVYYLPSSPTNTVWPSTAKSPVLAWVTIVGGGLIALGALILVAY